MRPGSLRAYRPTNPRRSTGRDRRICHTNGNNGLRVRRGTSTPLAHSRLRTASRGLPRSGLKETLVDYADRLE